MKLLPVTVSVNPGASAVAVLGLIELIEGPPTLKFMELETGTPEIASDTVTASFPGCAMSAAEIWAVSWDAETKVVGHGLPFHWTTDWERNSLPSTSSVKPGPPAAAPVGETPLTWGAGCVTV